MIAAGYRFSYIIHVCKRLGVVEATYPGSFGVQDEHASQHALQFRRCHHVLALAAMLVGPTFTHDLMAPHERPPRTLTTHPRPMF